jgi:hypothetical protein
MPTKVKQPMRESGLGDSDTERGRCVGPMAPCTLDCGAMESLHLKELSLIQIKIGTRAAGQAI